MTVFNDGFAKKSEGLHAAKVLGWALEICSASRAMRIPRVQWLRRTGWNGTPTRNLQLYVKHANLMSTWEPIYGKSLCIESLHDRVHRVALDSLGAITLHCRIRFARKTLSARASSCSTHKLFLLVNACVSGPQIFSIYVRPSIIIIMVRICIYIYTYINVQSSFQVYILYDLLLRNLVQYTIYIIIN